MTSRTYGDGCAIARALDVVGARWALLVVRELLFGPLRFTDLRRALPNASTNMLADRLRELGDAGVITQRQLAPPAAATVYELTKLGRGLEPILDALGEWGLQMPRPEPAQLSPASVMLFLQGAAQPSRKLDGSKFLVELSDRPFAVLCADGRLRARAGAPDDPNGSLRTEPRTLYQLLCRQADLTTVIEDGRVCVAGEQSQLAALIDAVPDAAT